MLDALGQHLDRPWQWWVTLTFRGYPGPARCRYALLAWLRAIRDSQGYLPCSICVTEWQRRGVLHYHLLMAQVPGNDAETRLAWRAKWLRNGRAHVMRYDRTRAARFYAGKYLFKGHGELTVSPNLPKWFASLEAPETPVPDSPMVRALATVFDIGTGQRPFKPGLQSPSVPSGPTLTAPC